MERPVWNLWKNRLQTSCGLLNNTISLLWKQSQDQSASISPKFPALNHLRRKNLMRPQDCSIFGGQIMDIGTTISEVWKEYKEYLRENHPDWAENTVKTHVSDAFYIWNNTLMPSFWKTLMNDESMEKGGQAIYNYWKMICFPIPQRYEQRHIL